ncbi:MAG: hypothetical protein KGQ88_05725, partial [Chloroflexi bacterium]|nr:hypothetical protein [Chloroflexota bacterium]
EAAYTYTIQEKVGFWSVNGGMDPAGVERNLAFYRGLITATGASPAPVSAIADSRFVKAALDTLGGPIASTTDPASWYKK